MISRTLFLKEYVSKTIEPAILVVNEKLIIQYHSPNTSKYVILPKTFTALKQLDGLNKIALTSNVKKAIQSIKSYTDIRFIENLSLEKKNYSINLTVEKLQIKSLKESLFSISISKYKSSKIASINNHLQNGEEGKNSEVKFLKDKLDKTQRALKVLKKENDCLKKDGQTIQLNTTQALKEKQFELEKAEGLYKTLFENSIDGIVLFDLDNRKVVDVNKRLVKMTGFTKAEIIKKGPTGMMTEFLEDGQSTQEQYFIMLAELKIKKISSGIFMHLHKTKAPFYVKVNLYKMPKPHSNLTAVFITNIDARKKAEAKSSLRLSQLKTSESLHKTFFNQSLDGHFIFNLKDMKPVEINWRMLQILRLSKTEYFSANQYDFVDNENNFFDVEQILKDFKAHLDKKTPFELELYIKTSKRKSFLVKLLMIPLAAHDNHLVYGVVKDIDKEHQAELKAAEHLKALEASESMFRTFFENGLDGFGIEELFPEPKVIDINQRVCELFGLSKKKFIASNILDLINPIQPDNKSGQEVFDEISQSLLQKGFYRGEVVYIHKKNGPFYTNITMVRLKPPNDNKIFIQIADKDKEVKAIQQVAKSEALFKNIFSNSLDGIVIYNIDTFNMVNCNERVLEMTNCTLQEFVNAKTKDFLPEKQPNRKASLPLFKKHLKNVSENKSFNIEWLFKKYNSDELVYARISVVRLPEPFTKLAVISIADITEAKLAEQSIKEKNKTIAQTNEDLKLSLQKFKDTFNNSANFIGRIDLKGYLIEHNQTVSDNLFDNNEPSINIFVWRSPWFKKHKETQRQLKHDLELAKKGISTKSQVAYTVSLSFSGFLEYTLKPLFDDKDKVKCILAEGYDVTERVNTLKRLQINEQKFRAIYNSSSNFVGIFSTTGIILDLNQTATDGLTEEEVHVIGIPLWKFPWFLNHKDTQQTFRKAIKQAALGKTAEGIVEYTILPDFVGTIKYAIIPIFDDKGKVVWLLGEGKDISVIINTQKKLAYKEQKFKAIFNNSSNLIGLYDTDGYIEELNKPFLKHVDKSKFPEVIQKFKIWDIPWTTEYKFNSLNLKLNFKKTLKGKVSKGILEYKSNENYTSFFEYTMSPIFDENKKVIKVLCEGKDITEQINSRKQIEASEKRFKALFFNAENLIVRLSPKGRVIEHSRIQKGTKNYEQVKEYIGKYLWEFSGVFNNTEAIKQLKQNIDKAAKGNLVSGYILSKDSNHQPLQLAYSLKPIFNENNKVDWILGEAKDITTFVKTQNQLLENEQKFKAIFYNSENYIVRLDVKGNVLEHSRVHPDKLRYDTFKDYIGQPLWKFSGISNHPESAKQLEKDIKKCAKGNFVSNQMQMWVQKINKLENATTLKAGLVVYSLTPVFNKKSKVDWILAEAKDITKLKEAQNELSSSFDKYQKLFENNLVGIITLDENLKIINCNKAYEKITGYTLDESKTFDYYNLIDEKEIEEAKSNERKIKSSKVQSLQFKRHLIRKNGEKVIVHIYLKPIYINGAYSSAVVTIADISELENKRKALKESEQLYKAVFEGVNDGLYVYNYKNHNLITFNNRLMKIAGYKSRKQFLNVVNKTYIPFVIGKNDSKINWIRKIDGQLKLRKIAKFDFTFQRDNGATLDISTTTIKLSDSLALTAVTDVTETKRAQNALSESENKYRSLFESNVTGIALGNKFGETLQANDALCAIFGYTKNEMLQLKHQDLTVQDENDQSYPNFSAMVEGKVEKFSTTKQFIKKSGEMFYAIINVSAIYDEQNKFKYNIASISDISELKSLENELKEKQIELADKVKELEKYIESNLELENFAFIASHDLKSPTKTIINFSNLLLHTAEHKLDKQEREFLKFIVDGSNRLQNTINDLLNFSLANNNDLNIEKVNLKNVIKNVIKDLDSLCIKTNAIITIEYLPSYNWIDKGLYKQLFLNLITNAIKFQKKGKQPIIKINCKKTSDGFVFSIKDNGIGIVKKFQQKIFGIFKRLHVYNEFEGTGIGLALCKKVVEKHEGKIWVESAKAKGSTFYFTLPNNLKQHYEKI